MDQVEKNEFNKIIEELKYQYMTRVRLRTGSKFALKGKYSGSQDFWMTLALKVKNSGLLPEEWVAIQFERFKPYPWLNQLTSDIPKEEVESRKNYLVEKLQRYIESQVVTVQFEMRLGRSLSEVLLDSKVNLNPLMRYCLAVSGNLPEVAEYYKEPARQLLRLNNYRQAYAKYLPQLEIPNAG